MAAPTIRQVQAAVGTGTLTLTTSSATAVGDWLFAITQTAFRESSDLVAPGTTTAQRALWTHVTMAESSESNTGMVKIRAWRRKVTTGGAQTVTYAPSGSSNTSALAVYTVAGADPDEPMDGVATANAGASGTQTVGAIVTTSADARLIGGWGAYGNSIGYVGATTPLSVAAASGATRKLSDNNAFMVASGALTSSGSSGNKTASYDEGPPESWAGLLFAVKSGKRLSPTGIPSAEVFGHPTVLPGLVTISGAGGITSAEVFGTPGVAPGQEVGPVGGIPSAEALGTPTVTPGTAVLRPSGIPSGQAFGVPTLVPGTVTLGPVGIPSAEAFGDPRLRFGLAETDLPRAYSRTTIPYPEVQYELVCVARIPQQSGPPLLIEMDPIDWTGLSYGEELSKAASLDASCQMSKLTEPVLQRLRNPTGLATELWLNRQGVRVFAGPLVGADIKGEDVKLQCRGLLHYLRGFAVTTDLVFTGVDQALIVQALINHHQALAYGNYGLVTTGLAPTGVARDVTYLRKELHNIGLRIEEMGRSALGFDIEVDPVTRAVQLWSPQQGVDRSVGEDAIVFDARNVTSGGVLISAAPGDVATDALVTGTSGDTTYYAEAFNADLRATFGRTTVTGTFDQVADQATADGHALGLVSARGAPLIVPGPGLRTTADADLSAYSVGDTVSYQVHERLGINGAFRLRKRTVTVQKTGQESTAVEFA